MKDFIDPFKNAAFLPKQAPTYSDFTADCSTYFYRKEAVYFSF